MIDNKQASIEFYCHLLLAVQCFYHRATYKNTGDKAVALHTVAGEPPAIDIATEVAIIGAGPSGLMLAIELGCRGVPCVLLEAQVNPPKMPKANATSARTMEHYRRRGFAHLVRAAGLAADHPQDVMYCTRLTGQEAYLVPMPGQVLQQALDGRRHRIAGYPALAGRAFGRHHCRRPDDATQFGGGRHQQVGGGEQPVYVTRKGH